MVVRSLVILAVFLAACGEALPNRAAEPQFEQDAQPEQRIDIDEVVESFRAQFNQPAMAAAVVRGGEIIARSERGVRALNTGEPIQHGDRWNLGGVSTSIVATAIAKLVERDQLSWERRVVDVFPLLAGRILQKYQSITIRDLLNHRAGLLPFTSGSGQIEVDINNSLTGDAREKRAQFVEKVLNQPPVNEPGTVFEYSNAGYAIAAAMIEETLDTSLEAALKELVFDPLSMDSGALSMPATVERPDDTWGHHPIRDQLIAIAPSPVTELPEILEPSNGVSCSIEDLARFASAHLQALREEEVQGIDGQSLRRLHEVVIDRTAMGWFRQEIVGEMCHFNRGSSGLFYCWVMIWPEKDLAVVTTSNAGNGEEACRLLAEALYTKFAR